MSEYGPWLNWIVSNGASALIIGRLLCITYPAHQGYAEPFLHRTFKFGISETADKVGGDHCNTMTDTE